MTQNSGLITKLVSLGLSENQARIYLSVIERGKATVLEIFRDTGIQRPTVYENVLVLQDKNLLSQIVIGKKRYISAHEADALLKFVEEKRTTAREVADEISALTQHKVTSRTPIKIFSGVEGAKLLADVILSSASKEILTVGSYAVLNEVFSERYLRQLWAARSKKRIHARVLFNASDAPALRKDRSYGDIGNITFDREVRLLSASLTIPAMFTLVDDTVLFWSRSEEDIFFSIKYASHTKTWRSLFENLWANSDPYIQTGDEAQ